MSAIVNYETHIREANYDRISDQVIEDAFSYLEDATNPKEIRDRVKACLMGLILALKDSNEIHSGSLKNLEQRITKLTGGDEEKFKKERSKLRDGQAQQESQLKTQSEQINELRQSLLKEKQIRLEYELGLVEREIEICRYDCAIFIEDGLKVGGSIALDLAIGAVFLSNCFTGICLYACALPSSFLDPQMIDRARKLVNKETDTAMDTCRKIDHSRTTLKAWVLFDNKHKAITYWEQIKKRMTETGCSLQEAKASISRL